jgi:hypothetical protein
MVTYDPRHGVFSALVDSTEVGVGDLKQTQTRLRRAVQSVKKVKPDKKDELYARSIAIGQATLAGWRNLAQKRSAIPAPTLWRLEHEDQSFKGNWASSENPIEAWVEACDERIADLEAPHTSMRVKAFQELISLSVDLALWSTQTNNDYAHERAQ